MEEINSNQERVQYKAPIIKKGGIVEEINSNTGNLNKRTLINSVERVVIFILIIFLLIAGSFWAGLRYGISNIKSDQQNNFTNNTDNNQSTNTTKELSDSNTAKDDIQESKTKSYGGGGISFAYPSDLMLLTGDSSRGRTILLSNREFDYSVLFSPGKPNKDFVEIKIETISKETEQEIVDDAKERSSEIIEKTVGRENYSRNAYEITPAYGRISSDNTKTVIIQLTQASLEISAIAGKDVDLADYLDVITSTFVSAGGLSTDS